MEGLGLHGWENFYVIVGSSAGALTGLTFIVITISSSDGSGGFSNSPVARLMGMRAFITPIAVHFCSALWVSFLLSVPVQTVLSLTVCLGVTGLAGAVYCAQITAWMLRTRVHYKPFLSDWIWNVILPGTSYLALLVAALLLSGHTLAAMLVVAAASVLMLFIGIHNAWDVVAWITTERHAYGRRRQGDPGRVEDDSGGASEDANKPKRSGPSR